MMPLHSRPIRRLAACAVLSAIATTTTPAGASTVSDPIGDFIPTFTGVRSPDLDVTAVSATVDATTLHLAASVNGPVGTLASALYVFGINRGAGVSNFAAIGLPGVIFDAVITMTGAGVLGGRDLVANQALVVPAGNRSISGNSFAIDVPLSLLPSLGLAVSQYEVNLWPRDASVSVANAQISDFAPDATNLRVSPVPEPSSYALLLAGGSLIALLVRRRRHPRGA